MTLAPVESEQSLKCHCLNVKHCVFLFCFVRVQASRELEGIRRHVSLETYSAARDVVESISHITKGGLKRASLREQTQTCS